MMMYADDTTIYCNIAQNVSDEVMYMELSKVSQWLTANKFISFDMHQKAVTYLDQGWG